MNCMYMYIEIILHALSLTYVGVECSRKLHDLYSVDVLLDSHSHQF